MVSFDVSSLFTNVPIKDTLDFLKNYLQSHTVDMPFHSDVLLKLIELCTNNCYFLVMVMFSDKREACQWVAVFHRFLVIYTWNFSKDIYCHLL